MLLYFDLDCCLCFAWKGIQPTVLQLFLRYSVETYKCTNASELIKLSTSLCELQKLWLTLTGVLSRLFTAMLRHGYIPECLRDCILKPILKPGKDPSNSDSYRPIALAPTLSKLFEWCILIEHKPAFATSSLQFGFKQGLSTDLCTGLTKNVTRYYVNDTEVFGCFLDASKAFDQVDRSVLFEKLLTVYNLY